MFLEKALEECGNDLDSTIKSLNELRLGSAQNNLGFGAGTSDVGLETKVQLQSQGFNKTFIYVTKMSLLCTEHAKLSEAEGVVHPEMEAGCMAGSDQKIGWNNIHVHVAGVAATNGEVVSSEDPSAPKNLSMDGAEWVELFVREMMSASNMDDARARASRALEVLEKSICARASAEAAQSFHQENLMLKEQVEALLQENIILKRAVSIQHERQKESEERNQELQHLKQVVTQYQEQLRTLEVNNYALSMHLRQAQQSSSIPGHFHPDVF
ncbi:hypothetical protein CK203_013130 [Vitis vinifera]|uniref:Uncharacterized protein n=1 Tax=Vitis vinifera TaxID=29760 RepID=A0A438JQG4_VITVI|nr:hypothetical protein CK203_013130 [Vitis vinifera]